MCRISVNSHHRRYVSYRFVAISLEKHSGNAITSRNRLQIANFKNKCQVLIFIIELLRKLSCEVYGEVGKERLR